MLVQDAQAIRNLLDRELCVKQERLGGFDLGGQEILVWRNAIAFFEDTDHVGF